MRGLLLKDWYMMKKYCKLQIIIAVAFIAFSLVSEGNMFFVFYPCLLCGMIPASLLGYDERSRWMQYSGTLPYKKAQIVSAKYLMGLFMQGALLIVTGVVQSITMTVAGQFVLGEFVVLMLLLLIVEIFTSSISLPFIFKLGVEKGRMAYYLMIGCGCCASTVASNYFGGHLVNEVQPNAILAALSVIGIGIYVLSWRLSVVFFRKREIQ